MERSESGTDNESSMRLKRNRIPENFSASALSLQHCPEDKSPENLWEDERVEVVGRVV